MIWLHIIIKILNKFDTFCIRISFTRNV